LQRALEEVEKIASPVTRIAGREIVPAFADEAAARGFDAIKELTGFHLPYPIGRKPDGDLLLVPIKPSFVLIEDGKLIPVFLVGWATLRLDDYQKQLVSSIIARSILTHQSFIDSDAEILCFPRIKRTRTRSPRSWRAKTYDILSEAELTAQFETYSAALRQVILRLQGE
jgi:hypothetical protein